VGETTVEGIHVVRSRTPAEALEHGEWFKLICGASNQDAPQVPTAVARHPPTT